MTQRFKRGVRALVAICGLAAALPAAHASDYPNKSVKVVVPFAAAGVTDIVARVVRRSPDLPGIPTVKETGIGDFDASTTYAIFAPAGTPKDTVERLSAEIRKALDDETVQQKLRAAGVQPGYRPPDAVTQMLGLRIPQWGDVINSAGIRIN